MMFPPSILRLRIHNQQHHFSLWLPLFLLWPLLLVLGLLLLPLLLIAAVILSYRGWGIPLLLLGPTIFGLLCAMRGLKVEIGKNSEQAFISLQ